MSSDSSPSVDIQDGPPIVPDRSCGTCMMCCKVPYIEEFNKAPGVWCQHAAPGKGCAIYETRPGTCRSFYCTWMQDPKMGPEWKPDRAKFVVYLQRNGRNLQVAVDPSFPNAWTRAPYYAQIKQWAKGGADAGQFVFVRIGQRMIAVLPDRDQDIGVVDPADEIVVARKPAASGYTYTAEVKRRAAAT